MIVRIAIALLLGCTLQSLQAQEIKGRITNKVGEPIKYATIYIDELQTGTSANQNGIYDIRVVPGIYTLSVRSLGYSPTVKSVKVTNTDVELDIELDIQSYILAGVTVRADDEDPAYAIMRKAIARAPGFINQTKKYTSEVYIKGSLKFNKIPRMLAKQMEINGDRPKEGTTYVNESINRIKFTAPDSYEQEVISVNNSFPINDDDVPVIGMLSNSIYESVDDFYISPFAPNAFAHYKFSYEGLLQDGSWFVDKIKVIPKRKSKLLLEGYLYIVEDLWCVYSYELKMNPPYTELEIKQHYAPVKGNTYLPVNLFGTAKIKVMGVSADANYTTTIKYKSVELNPLFAANNIKSHNMVFDTTTYVENEEIKDPKIEKVDKQIDDLLQNAELNNREMVQLQKLISKKASLEKQAGDSTPLEIKSNYHQVVSKDALIRDSIYWDSVRPVPASDDEKISYQKIVEKEAKEDSTSLAWKIGKTILFGNYEWERSKAFHMYYPGLVSLKNVGFNPVDGFQVKQSFKARWAIDSLKLFRLYGNLGYAINRQAVFGSGTARFQYARLKRGQLELKGGYQSRDFNNKYGTPEGLNAIYNLFSKQNYIKQYHDAYFGIQNQIDLANGLASKLSLNYHEIDSIGNSTDFSLLYPNKSYEPNLPVNSTIGSDDLSDIKQFGVSLILTYTPQQHYRINKGIKYMSHSKWPTFSLKYNGGIPIDDSYADYHFIETSVNQKIDIYTTSQFRYRMSAGGFLSNKRMHFSMYKHFKTVEEIFTTRNLNNAFVLLNNYEYSTKSYFFDVNLKYTNEFLLLKHLPVISNQLWKENLYFNTLVTNQHYPYYEFGYSLSQLFFAGEIGVFTGFKGSSYYMTGVRALFEF